MGPMRVMFLVTAIASAGYAAGLLIPGLYPTPEFGPEGVAWPRYLAPIYLGLAVIAWSASRRPARHVATGWGFVVIWGGLVATHLWNLLTGDEQVGLITIGLLMFDTALFVLMLSSVVRAARVTPYD